ncbi:F-box domain-containing protein [Xylariales sp. AK1849]|nr:F-box domain-containing protein [Xylariales sp. AK1849]
MVEVMRAPSLGPHLSGSMDMMEMATRFSDVKLAAIHETEEAVSSEAGKGQFKELKKGSFRAPRRAFSSNDYHLPTTPTCYSGQAAYPSPSARYSETKAYFSPYIPTSDSQTSTPQTPTDPQHAVVSLSVPLGHVPLSRPILPSPQRSYSVMDYEPIPVLQLPGEQLRLVHLPSELHFAIFDFLDPIDSTCLGLTSKHFYAIHRRMHGGKTPLSVRRDGPNDMEWAWRLARPLIAAGQTRENAMAMVLPRGQVYCRKCGISRCELHKHIQEWMGDRYEYCEVRQKFGPVAAPNARKSCYRSSPRHPHRCGRHVRQQRTVRLV